MRFAVDTGGTFTDLVVEDAEGGSTCSRRLRRRTIPRRVCSTSSSERRGISGTDRRILLGQAELFLHGTTHATNAILTGTTARTAFLTTRGHPDILLFREGGRTDIFDWSRPYPEPYVPRALTYEVPERIGAEGEIVRALDKTAATEDRPRAGSRRCRGRGDLGQPPGGQPRGGAGLGTGCPRRRLADRLGAQAACTRLPPYRSRKRRGALQWLMTSSRCTRSSMRCA